MSLFRGTPASDTELRKIEERIREEEARQRRMILQGMPTQAGDDLLRQLRATLQKMKGQRPPMWR